MDWKEGIYKLLVLIACVMPFLNLAAAWIFKADVVNLMVLWSVVVAAVFFMEYMLSAQ
jgi:hypothetical protein